MHISGVRMFLVCLLSCSVLAQTMPNDKNLMGFSAENSRSKRHWKQNSIRI